MPVSLSHNSKRLAGITLAEILIVAVIVAALAIIVFWASRTQVYKGYDSRRKSDIAVIKIAVEQYEKDHDCYPLPEVVSCNPGTGLQPYLEKIPCDPKTGASYYYEYDPTGCPKWYRFYAKLENKTDKQAIPGIGPNGDFNYFSGSSNASIPTAGGGGMSLFYGCKSGVCTLVAYDPTKPGAICDPNYATSDCGGRCLIDGQPANECLPWR